MGEQLRVSVVVLEPLAVERRTSRRAADQEAFRARIARQPNLITDALEAALAAVGEEQDEWLVEAGRRARPRRGRPR